MKALLILGILAAALLAIVRSRIRKQSVDAVFSGADCSGDVLNAISNALASVNTRGQDRTFGINRAGDIALRGERIWIVSGPVDSTVAGTYGPRRSGWNQLYAVAKSDEQSVWMRSNPDLFVQISDDSSFRIFWLELSGLAATRRETTITSDGNEMDLPAGQGNVRKNGRGGEI